MSATPGPWTVVVRDVAYASGAGSLERTDYHLGFDIEGPPQAQRGQFANGADARLAASAPELADALAFLCAEVNNLTGEPRCTLERLQSYVSEIEPILDRAWQDCQAGEEQK